MIKLTRMEMEFLNGMRTNEYSDILETGGDWLFAVIGQCSYDEIKAKGVISSLKTKGLISTHDEGEGVLVGFTEAGKLIWNEADGAENTGWGGPRLLNLDKAGKARSKGTGELSQLRKQVMEILEKYQVNAQVQVRMKRSTMIMGDVKVKGDVTPHVKITMADGMGEFEMAKGEHNILTWHFSNQGLIDELMALGF